MTIEIRHLRCLLAIQEAGTISAAGAQLHLSQPAVSRALRQLEEHLGVRLVNRSTHHLDLTEEGFRFATGARTTLGAMERAVLSVGETLPPLRIGQSWATGGHLSRIIREWDLAHQGRPVQTVHFADRTAGLVSGQVDVAITRGPIREAGFDYEQIDSEIRYAVVSSTSDLAQSPSLQLSDLAELPLVIQSTTGTTRPDLWPSGSRPAVALDATGTDEWLLAIATGKGFGVTVESTRRLHVHPDVRFIPLVDAPEVPLLVAWHRSGQHPDTSAFVSVALDNGAYPSGANS